jgi:hypothetical protein
VYIFDKFVEDDEIEALLKWGEHFKFSRSTDTGPVLSRFDFLIFSLFQFFHFFTFIINSQKGLIHWNTLF